MSPTDHPGRVAGLWYLLLIVIGPLRSIYIPTKLFVDGNAAATVNNIAAHEWLFRFGIVSDLVCGVMLIFLVLAFYRLFKGVDQALAVLVVIFGGVMPALLTFVGVVSDAAALMVVRGGDVFPHSTNLSGTRWRCSSSICVTINTQPPRSLGRMVFPLPLLVHRSRFLPRFPRRLAGHRRLRPCDPEPHRGTVAAIPGQGVYLLSARLLRRAGDHAVARDQGCQAASGRDGLIVGG